MVGVAGGGRENLVENLNAEEQVIYGVRSSENRVLDDGDVTGDVYGQEERGGADMENLLSLSGRTPAELPIEQVGTDSDLAVPA